MTLYETIISEYPELEGSQYFMNDTIVLRNDGESDYIAKWNYSKPLPESLTQYMRGSN